MKAKLLHLMEQLQLKPGQFARILEINPAIISHIVAERNKPGVDLLQKILTKFPQVNPDWLLLDSDEMFRPTHSTDNSSVVAHPHSAVSTDRSLFASSSPNDTEKRVLPLDSHASSHTPNTNGIDFSHPPQPTTSRLTEHTIADKPICRVVLFYADGSFDSFIPTSNP